MGSSRLIPISIFITPRSLLLPRSPWDLRSCYLPERYLDTCPGSSFHLTTRNLTRTDCLLQRSTNPINYLFGFALQEHWTSELNIFTHRDNPPWLRPLSHGSALACWPCSPFLPTCWLSFFLILLNEKDERRKPGCFLYQFFGRIISYNNSFFIKQSSHRGRSYYVKWRLILLAKIASCFIYVIRVQKLNDSRIS